jgi:hypothetical protein
MAYNRVVIGTTATKIVSVNANRQSLIITNVGTEDVYLGPDSSLTSSIGIPLVQYGSITEDRPNGQMWLGDVYGIAGAAGEVRYWER